MDKIKTTTESWVTAIIALLTAINQILALTGHNPFSGISSDELYNVVTAIVTVIVMGVSYWRDHPWTEASCEGTGLTRMLKAQGKGKIYKEPEEKEPEADEAEEGDADEDV